jgi:hypothetical protein
MIVSVCHKLQAIDRELRRQGCSLLAQSGWIRRTGRRSIKAMGNCESEQINSANRRLYAPSTFERIVSLTDVTLWPACH